MSANDDPRRSDWEAAKARLHDLGDALTRADPLSKEQSIALLRRRAEHLARVADPPPETDETLEVVCFQLSGERVAVAADLAIELLTLRSVTPIPNSPAPWIGITNLRGQVCAIVDLCVLLEMPRSDLHHPLALVLGRDQPEFGIAVDGVDQVRIVRRSELVAPPATTCKAWIKGVTPDGLLVIDGDRLIDAAVLHLNETD